MEAIATLFFVSLIVWAVLIAQWNQTALVHALQITFPTAINDGLESGLFVCPLCRFTFLSLFCVCSFVCKCLFVPFVCLTYFVPCVLDYRCISTEVCGEGKLENKDN